VLDEMLIKAKVCGGADDGEHWGDGITNATAYGTSRPPHVLLEDGIRSPKNRPIRSFRIITNKKNLDFYTLILSLL